MTKLFALLVSALALSALTACSSGDPSDSAAPTCPTGYEECGEQCMSLGNSCCPNDNFSCPSGTLCNLDNQCVISTSDTTNCLPGRERCGISCMPVGGACCDVGKGTFCDVGWTCFSADKCQQNGVPPKTTAPVTNVVVTTPTTLPTPVNPSGPFACGECPGWYTCSQWMPAEKCDWQSCTCYYQRNGSDTFRVWYQIGGPDHITGCVMCPDDGYACMPTGQKLIDQCNPS